MAPVLLLRETFGRRAQDASEAGAHAPNIAAVGGSGSILIVERVAAASVIVAAALSGWSGPPSVETAPAPQAPRISAEPPEARDGLAGPRPSMVALNAAVPSGSDKKGVAVVDELVEEVDDAVESPDRPREDDPEDDDDGGTPLGKPGAAEEKVVREVRRVVEKLPKQQ
jgi:hypothetical protein